MAENATKARKMIDGHRSHIRSHIDKYNIYREEYEKRNMVKQIENAQNQITSLRRKFSSIGESWEDTWRP